MSSAAKVIANAANKNTKSAPQLTPIIRIRGKGNEKRLGSANPRSRRSTPRSRRSTPRSRQRPTPSQSLSPVSRHKPTSSSDLSFLDRLAARNQRKQQRLARPRTAAACSAR